MAPGLRFQHPPPSSDGAMIVPPVPVGVHTAATRPSTPLANSDFPSGNVEGVRNAANREITRTYSPPSPASNANIPAPTPIQGFLSRGTAGLTPALTEVRLHSLEGDAGIPAVAHAEGTHSTPPSSRPTYRLDPAKVQQQIDRISRFRVLIMGRANAGKTTILQRVCNSTDQPEIVDGEGKKLDLTVVQGSMTRGYHNIESGLIFRSTPGFVFHDSCGFEAGSEEQFNIVMEFVRDRAKATKLDNRIHAIWFCIPLSDTHKVLNAEKRFFDKVDTGHVPVILLATKADTLELEVFEQAEDQGLSADDAEIAKLEKEILNNHMENLKDQLGRTRFPPHDYLSLSGMQVEGADCTPLLRCTADVLEEDGLQQLLISTLQSNLGVCIEYAIMKTLRRHMKEHGHEIVPKSLAMDLAMWFPYNYEGIEEQEQEHKERQQRLNKLQDILQDLNQQQQLQEEQLEQQRQRLKERFQFLLNQQQEEEFEFQLKLDPQQYLNMILEPPIELPLPSINIPTLSDSMQYSMQYIAEHGIGVILVVEHLYFLLQVKNRNNGTLEELNLVVREYQSTGICAKVNRFIQEAFWKYGEDVEVLCPILVDIAKENQMSKYLS